MALYEPLLTITAGQEINSCLPSTVCPHPMTVALPIGSAPGFGRLIGATYPFEPCMSIGWAILTRAMSFCNVSLLYLSCGMSFDTYVKKEARKKLYEWIKEHVRINNMEWILLEYYRWLQMFFAAGSTFIIR